MGSSINKMYDIHVRMLSISFMGLACLQLSIFENESCNLINGENDAIATELRFLRIHIRISKKKLEDQKIDEILRFSQGNSLV